MARWTKRDSKRFALCIVAVFSPALVILTLLSGEPRFWWEYAGIVLWTILGVHAVYRLIRERKALV